MSTEIPEPAPQAPAADQPDRPDPAGPAGSAGTDGPTGRGGPAGLDGPTAVGAADGGPAAYPGQPDEVWQQPAEVNGSAGLPKRLLPVTVPDSRAMVSVAAVSVLLSVAVAGLWVWLAPAVQGTLTQGAVYYTSPESKTFIGQDGTLGVICFVLGLLLGVAAYLVFGKRASVGAVIGLAGGGLAGGYLATKLGDTFGPGHGKTIQQMVIGMHENTTFALPMQLRAVAMIWLWPLAAIAVYFLLAIMLGPVDPPQPQPQWAPDDWQQQGQLPEYGQAGQPGQQQGQPGQQPWPDQPDQQSSPQAGQQP